MNTSNKDKKDLKPFTRIKPGSLAWALYRDKTSGGGSDPVDGFDSEKKPGFKIKVVKENSFSPPVEKSGGFATTLVKSRKMPKELYETLCMLVRDEMHAMTTYMHQASVVNGLGYVGLAEHFWEEANEEMVHAMKLMDRINIFDVIPSIEQIPIIKHAGDIEDLLQHQLDLEMDALKKYNKAVTLARSLEDQGTEELLRDILVDEEGHFDWLTTQLSKIKDIGKERYLQSVQEEIETEPTAWEEKSLSVKDINLDKIDTTKTKYTTRYGGPF